MIYLYLSDAACYSFFLITRYSIIFSHNDLIAGLTEEIR